MPRFLWLCFLGLALGSATAASPQFHLPTPNRFLLDPPQPDKFFAPTPGKTWESGSFGCVRSEGGQMHEGIDILFTERDRRGEPTDAILAAAPGTVAYINRKAGLSNYGQYLILYHQVEGLEFYSLYAHLSRIDPELRPGKILAAAHPLGVMGRSTNTRQPIFKERAHLHFEVGFLVNEKFPRWLEKRFPGQRNDHGLWNGRNLLAIDPAALYREQHELGDQFRFFDHLTRQVALCRVLVRKTSFPWLERYPRLVAPNPRAQEEGTAAYELSLNFNGIPFRLIPRAASEADGAEEVRLLSVDEEEFGKRSCRRLVKRSGKGWQLTSTGQDLISLLTFTP